MKSKVLFIAHSLSHGGGSEKVLSILLGRLHDKYDISVIEHKEDAIAHLEIPADIKKIKSISYYPTYLRNNNKSVIKGRLISLIQDVILLLCPNFIYRYFVNERFDVEVSFNYLYPSILVAASSNPLSYKIMWVHSDIYDLDYSQYKGLSKLKSWIHYNAQKRAFERAHVIVSISKMTKQSIIDIFPQFQNKIKLIYNGYEFNDFLQLSMSFECEKTHAFRIIAVGTLEKRKNFELLVRAVLSIVSQKKLDVELIILGKGDEYDNLAATAGDELDNHIKLLGFQANPYPYIKSADCLAIPSLSEGFPTVAIEAIALNTPVISTLVGGIDEIIQPNINGLIADRSVDSFEEKILYMANNYNQFENPSKTVEKYTAEEWARNTQNLIAELQNGKNL